MVSLAKTPASITAGRVQAAINAGLRKNALPALQMELGNRIADARDRRLPIGPREEVEEYRMRSSSRYVGDLVHHHTREIGRRKYDFSRVEWGNGDVSVTAWIAGTTIAVHMWDGVRD